MLGGVPSGQTESPPLRSRVGYGPGMFGVCLSGVLNQSASWSLGRVRERVLVAVGVQERYPITRGVATAMWQGDQPSGHPGWRGSGSVNYDSSGNTAGPAMPGSGASQSMQQQPSQQHQGQRGMNQHAFSTPQVHSGFSSGAYGLMALFQRFWQRLTVISRAERLITDGSSSLGEMVMIGGG